MYITVHYMYIIVHQFWWKKMGMDWYWDRYGLVLGQVWIGTGTGMDWYWDRYGLVLGQVWTGTGTGMDRYWDRYGLVLTSLELYVIYTLV